MASIAEEFPNLDSTLDLFARSAREVKQGLQDDGKLNLDEIIEAIPLDKGREEIRGLLSGLKGMYPEVARMRKKGPYWMMTRGGPYLMEKFMDIIGSGE
ncbi:MAG: hypothetical protein LC778_10280 [Acidobacteria bacterium]|nr:hypothetical protein [Acidobacteriota bacterium]